MSFKSLKLLKLATYIAGGGLGGVFIFLALVLKTESVIILAAGGMLISVAGAIGAAFPSPAQAVVKDAPIVTPGGTPTGALNLSSTSTISPDQVKGA